MSIPIFLFCLSFLSPSLNPPFILLYRQAAETDGKMANNLVKLQLFREFYVMVVAYVYFTRIVVYLLEATIPFYLYWFGELFTELATFLLFVVTGYKFRPVADNPYLQVSTSEEGGGRGGEEGGEYGLEDHDGDEAFELEENSKKGNMRKATMAFDH